MSHDTTRLAQAEFHFAPLCQCGCGQPLKIAKKPSQQSKYIVGHHAKSLKIPFAERFWSHVEILGPDDCWLWQAAVVKDYGKFKADDRKMLASHRIAYELTYGPIPDGLLVCHECDTPLCCNPKHLFAGTPKDNTQDMVKKGRKGDAKGELHGRHILTEQQVLEIRELYAQGGVTHADLAQRFGVGNAAIHHVVSGDKWTHVGGPITRSRVDGVTVKSPKLTIEDVREIRRLHATGDLFQREIAEKFGVTQTNVGMIVRGITWRDN